MNRTIIIVLYCSLMNMSGTNSIPNRMLVVMLGDIGDALLTIPALGALRQSFSNTRIDALTSPVGAKVLQRFQKTEQHVSEHSPDIYAGVDGAEPLLDDVVVLEKRPFDTPRALLSPANLRYIVQVWRVLRDRQYDTCLIFHHFTTWFGTVKFTILTAATGAKRRYGLDNGRGFFLTNAVRDEGFGAHHQAEYWLALAALAGAKVKDISKSLPITPDEERAAAVYLGSTSFRGIALHPGAGAFAPARRWPPQRWAELADALIDDGVAIILVGGPEEAELRRTIINTMRHRDAVIDMGGRTSLGLLAAILKQCVLFIGNDSGLAHLAGNVATPVVAIFGPTDPRAWGPYADQPWHVEQIFPNGVEVLAAGPHRALHSAIACSPCIYRGHRLGTPAGCPDRTCLRRIDVQQALSIVRHRLEAIASHP
jgi:ADP-heptose:LPS heptosyltransferase